MLAPAEHFTLAPLLSARGLIKKVRLFKRKCPCCEAEHHLSYATGGLRLQRGEQVPYLYLCGGGPDCARKREMGNQNPDPKTQNPKPKTQCAGARWHRKAESKTQNPKPKTQTAHERRKMSVTRTTSSESRTQNPKPKTQTGHDSRKMSVTRTTSSESRIQNPKPKTQTRTSGPLSGRSVDGVNRDLRTQTLLSEPKNPEPN